MRPRAVAAAGPNQQAADAAVELAACGGNAVDAALAAVLVAMVNEPGVASLGGGAFVTVARPGAPAVTVDGNVEMPGRAAPRSAFGSGARQVTTAYGGGITMTIGHGSVAVPGALAAFGAAHARYGTAPWREVLAPAIRVAREGFLLGQAAASYIGLVHEEVFGWNPHARASIRVPDGSRVLVQGERMTLHGLADALDRLADAGPGDFYTGDLARQLVAEMAAGGGLVGAADLAEYRPRLAPSLPVELGDWSLATNPPPSIGGPVLAALLALAGDKPDVRRLVEVQRAVLLHRIRQLDVAQDRAAAAAAMLDAIAADGGAWLRGAPSTVHVSAVDSDGTACSVTASSGYGSGVVVPGTGIWLNNCLGEPELNRLGFHAWPPGTRLPSNMAPTTGRRRDGAVLAIGSPGADRITTALAQVLLAMSAGADLAEAVSAPRVHLSTASSGGTDGSVLVEHEEDLPLPDLDLPTRSWPRHSMFFGGVTAAMLDGDRLHAAADPRRGGGTAVG